MLTGVVTLCVLALGSAGAAAVTHTLTIESSTGAPQKIAPVVTGTTMPSPGESLIDDKSVGPTGTTGTTTVRPAEPMYVDDHGDTHPSGTSDGVAHDLSEDTGVSHDSSPISRAPEGSSSVSAPSGDTRSSADTGSSGGSGSPSDSDHGGGSDDTGGQR